MNMTPLPAPRFVLILNPFGGTTLIAIVSILFIKYESKFDLYRTVLIYICLEIMEYGSMFQVIIVHLSTCNSLNIED